MGQNSTKPNPTAEGAREFWIDASDYVTLPWKAYPLGAGVFDCFTRVIEKSAFDKLQAELARAKELLREAREAMQMGAFHHSACGANFYEDNSKKPDWNGIGEHRMKKPCTCAHWKIDLSVQLIDESGVLG